jgi:hypothetical protein
VTAKQVGHVEDEVALHDTFVFSGPAGLLLLA